MGMVSIARGVPHTQHSWGLWVWPLTVLVSAGRSCWTGGTSCS